jgi:oligopeptide/dipeptide ABC transporter ATP-binding protein
LTQPLLEVKNLEKHFQIDRNRVLKAVDGISFEVFPGETFGLVGESGCGKSTAGRTIIDLYNATSGEVLFAGQNVHQLKGKKQKKFRRDMQMIFQDPYASLNPRKTVMDIIAEGLEIHDISTGKSKQEIVYELLETVGLNKSHATRYPHEFSGGQRQRIGIARALAMEPKFIIADEPISALDVSVQAQVVNLMRKLQKEKGLTYLFIAHDLSMVKYISDRVGVMYLGKMAELAESDELYKDPLHPYTQGLLATAPIPDPTSAREREKIRIKGELPSPLHPPSGCRFRTRCPHAMEICAKVDPAWQEVKPKHWVACHLYPNANPQQ